MHITETYPKGTYLIYAIRHSHDIDMEYRYVGMTNDLHRRAKKHIRDANSGVNRYVCKWIVSHLGFVTFDVLEICTTKDELILAERKWILVLKERGYRLVNHTDGGEGSFGRVHKEDSKRAISNSLKLSWSKRELSDEYRDNIRKRDKYWSEDARKKASERSTDRVHTQESKNKMSEAHKGRNNPNVAKGNHTRYHTNKGISKPECRFCTQG